jgi:hypothetical protein
MASSTLEHDENSPPAVTKGHGTAALGPSDSSDSGSDIQGGPGLNHEDGLLAPTGTTSDPDIDGDHATAGADLGDANLDSDSDRGGTGERAAAGRDATLPNDQLLRDDDDELIDGESIGDIVDSERPSGDEVLGTDVVRADLESDGDLGIPRSPSPRPSAGGQDARRPPATGARARNASKPGGDGSGGRR